MQIDGECFVLGSVLIYQKVGGVKKINLEIINWVWNYFENLLVASKAASLYILEVHFIHKLVVKFVSRLVYLDETEVVSLDQRRSLVNDYRFQRIPLAQTFIVLLDQFFEI